MKANQSVSVTVSNDFELVVFEVLGEGSIELDMTKLHPDIVKRAACAGMAQVRIVDAAAVGRTDSDGNVIDEASRNHEKFRRMKALVDHYMTGTSEWKQARAEGTPRAKGGVTLQAIANIHKKTLDEMRVRVENLARAKDMTYAKMLKVLSSANEVQDEIARLRGTDETASDMLAELMD